MPNSLGTPEPIDLPACPPDREARTHALLQAFDHEVRAQAGKAFSPKQAEVLRTLARTL